ncbi:MAG TPA: hypothetical protein VF519_11495 [Mycobacteriales bacterium]|jgi:hypothetical protein
MRRIALLGVAAALAFAPAASAEPIPGCYGYADAVYCDIELAPEAAVPTQPTRVCVGTCTYVPVPTTGEPVTPNVCFTYTTPEGGRGTQCAVNYASLGRAVGRVCDTVAATCL